MHHNQAAPLVHSCDLARASWLADRLAAQSRFLRRHGLVLDFDLVELMPRLVMPGGEVDLAAARLLLDLVGEQRHRLVRGRVDERRARAAARPRAS